MKKEKGGKIEKEKERGKGKREGKEGRERGKLAGSNQVMKCTQG